MFCLYCLLNMFLAILNESYAVVKLADALEPSVCMHACVHACLHVCMHACVLVQFHAIVVVQGSSTQSQPRGICVCSVPVPVHLRVL